MVSFHHPLPRLCLSQAYEVSSIWVATCHDPLSDAKTSLDHQHCRHSAWFLLFVGSSAGLRFHADQSASPGLICGSQLGSTDHAAFSRLAEITAPAHVSGVSR